MRGRGKNIQKGKIPSKDTNKEEEEEVPSSSKETQGGTSEASQGVQTMAEKENLKIQKIMSNSEIMDRNEAPKDSESGG